MSINASSLLTTQGVAIAMAQERVDQAQKWQTLGAAAGDWTQYGDFRRAEEVHNAAVNMIYAKAGNRPLNQNELTEVIGHKLEIERLRIRLWDNAAVGAHPGNDLYRKGEIRRETLREIQGIVANNEAAQAQNGSMGLSGQYASAQNPFNTNEFLKDFYKEFKDVSSPYIDGKKLATT